jgi:hypothetical protein
LIHLQQSDSIFLPIDHFFSAIAPIGPMLPDRRAVEDVAQAALEAVRGPAILVLAHWPADAAGVDQPFQRARLFPWGATSRAARLDRYPPITRTAGGELWAAVAVEAEPADGPFVLEHRHGKRISRQAVLVAEGWQTRIFLRADRVGTSPTDAGLPSHTDEGAFDVSIQMARPGCGVVYDDHWQTVEVARSALENGRAIFTGANLVGNLFHAKYDNPVAGLTGLHLFLDAKLRWEKGDQSYELASVTRNLGSDPQGVADEVLYNLTRLLHPRRAEEAEKLLGGAAARQDLLYPDANWPEASDLTALRVRAGRVKRQAFVAVPPMFRASWDVLKAHAARDGLTWIGRGLWRSTGNAGSLGPYVAWAPRRHSVERTLGMLNAHLTSMDRPEVRVSGSELATLSSVIGGAPNDEAEVALQRTLAAPPLDFSGRSVEAWVLTTANR